MQKRDMLALLYTLRQEIDDLRPSTCRIRSIIERLEEADIEAQTYPARKLRNICAECTHLDPERCDYDSRLLTVRGELDMLLKLMKS